MNPMPFGIFSSVSSPRTPIRKIASIGVELFYPASILANGTVLIDTPGVGSTHRHNTEAALQVLPECDAVLFVASADPPITEVGLDYLRRLQSKTTRIFFILNKADYLTPEDQRALPSSCAKSYATRVWIRQPRYFAFQREMG
jgi:GTPase Era involved in 16S rRNA processing